MFDKFLESLGLFFCTIQTVPSSDKIAFRCVSNASSMQQADPSCSQVDVIIGKKIAVFQFIKGNISDDSDEAEGDSQSEICTVCGEAPAAMHYGRLLNR